MTNKLEEARKIINDVDSQMAALFVKRMRAAEMVYEHKKEFGLPILDQKREKFVVEKNVALIEDEVLKEYYKMYIKNLMSISRAYQCHLKDTNVSKVTFEPCILCGSIEAPSSKSMTHRYLIGGAVSGKCCTITGVDYSEDILATIDCLKALGADITITDDVVKINSKGFMKVLDKPVLNCRESGSTLRFLIPLTLCLGIDVVFEGSTRLFERPLNVYEKLCENDGFEFNRSISSLVVNGTLEKGDYEIKGDVSSQFITGMIFALVYLGRESSIRIVPPFESKSYVNLTISSLKAFGAEIEFKDDYHIVIQESKLHSFDGKIEGDYSNAAFLDAFNYIGSNVGISNLRENSIQGDRVYKEYFEKIDRGAPKIDISDCPDLGPVLIALSALKNGATLIGTERLKIKESDRGLAMKEELEKLGGRLEIGDDFIIVPKQELKYQGIPLSGHNDHRIVMALSLILSVTGGTLDGIHAVKKSYPGFFEDLKSLGAKLNIE